MFKQRLKIVLQNIGLFFAVLVFLALWIGFIALLDKVFHISMLFDYMRKIAPIGIACLLGFLILYLIGKFIYWLFIEPFRKKYK